MLGHDAARSGGTARDIRPPFTRKWYRLFADEGIQSGVQPVVAEGKVFIGTLAGTLHAIDAETGHDVWSFQAGGPILHTAAVSAGRVCFGAADGVVYALEARDGREAWAFRTPAALWNAPAIHEGLVCIGGRDGILHALEVDTGNPRWRSDLGAPLLNSPAIDAKRGRVYIGSEALRVSALSLADGRRLWESEPLPGASLRGYHPVIAPDGSVMVTTQPVIGYDRFQALLLDLAREVFGDFASWRHQEAENKELRARNFRQMERPETHPAQLAYLRRRLTEEPAFQTFFILDPDTGKQRFVAPIVASESMNGPGAPPLVTGDGKVIVKYQVLLRSRYEHYSPFLNIGYLDTKTGDVTPIMDQTRTYGWHDSLLLVHDEQCQLSLAGRLLLNTHQDNVNALDLDTLRGYADPLALNIHEPAKDEALAIRLDAWRGRELPPGGEWLIRGTAVYGGGSVLDVPVAIANDSFYYLPTHELNAGCALIAYRATPGAPAPKRTPPSPAKLSPNEWAKIQDLPWDWDTLATPRLKSLLDSLPAPVPGTTAAPLAAEAEARAAEIPEAELDAIIWQPAFTPGSARNSSEADPALVSRLRSAVEELLARRWQPLVLPAAKAPEEAYRFFNDPSETAYTLLLARPLLDPEIRSRTDATLRQLFERGLPRAHDSAAGEARVPYSVPLRQLRVVDEIARDDLARLYVWWLYSQTEPGAGLAASRWPELRQALDPPAGKVDDDCGNSRLAGLIAACRLAKQANDQPTLDKTLVRARRQMRQRLAYELANTRGGVIRTLPNGRGAFSRWRRLTPDVARLLAGRALPIEQRLMRVYVDYHRPCWWLAWNIEQLMRNEAPNQLPTTPMEIFSARALILGESGKDLAPFIDLPWCRADEFYVQKLALTLLQR
jgi:hypothetical protein